MLGTSAWRWDQVAKRIERIVCEHLNIAGLDSLVTISFRPGQRITINRYANDAFSETRAT
jgi:hypothetical protein